MLIAYEDEKKRLEFLIAGCLNDIEGPDYLLAHYHQAALFQVNRTIRLLNVFEDKYFDDKENIRRLILKFKNDIETADSEAMRNYAEVQLQRFMDQLGKIDALSGKAKNDGDDKIVETALADLIAKRIRNLRSSSINPKRFSSNYRLRGVPLN